MFLDQDRLYMMRALQLASEAGGMAAPNPLVGAVLVYQDRIIGEGYHRQFGGPHAEVNCFDAVAQEDRNLIPDSTLYVTLEPCAHYGKTPPCALRILHEGVKKLVVANRDPFTAVNGKGIEWLKREGVEVELGLMEQEAAWLNRRFFTLHTKKRPFIILKWAQSQSGFFAPADRSRLQISNPLTRALNVSWRDKESAIMVGTTTALNDNPQLRSSRTDAPLRIALDKDLQIPESHYLLDRQAPTWLINELLQQEEHQLLRVQMDFDARLLPSLCSRLAESHYSSLVVEGGVALLQSFLQLDLWDEMRVFQTPEPLVPGIKAPDISHLSPLQQYELNDNRLLYYQHPQSAYPANSFALSHLPL